MAAAIRQAKEEKAMADFNKAVEGPRAAYYYAKQKAQDELEAAVRPVRAAKKAEAELRFPDGCPIHVWINEYEEAIKTATAAEYAAYRAAIESLTEMYYKLTDEHRNILNAARAQAEAEYNASVFGTS